VTRLTARELFLLAVGAHMGRYACIDTRDDRAHRRLVSLGLARWSGTITAAGRKRVTQACGGAR
jgi:hypothetical protein